MEKKLLIIMCVSIVGLIIIEWFINHSMNMIAAPSKSISSKQKQISSDMSGN